MSGGGRPPLIGQQLQGESRDGGGVGGVMRVVVGVGPYGGGLQRAAAPPATPTTRQPRGPVGSIGGTGGASSPAAFGGSRHPLPAPSPPSAAALLPPLDTTPVDGDWAAYLPCPWGFAAEAGGQGGASPASPEGAGFGAVGGTEGGEEEEQWRGREAVDADAAGGSDSSDSFFSSPLFVPGSGSGSGVDLGFGGPGAGARAMEGVLALRRAGVLGAEGRGGARVGESGGRVGMLPTLRPAFLDRYEVRVGVDLWGRASSGCNVPSSPSSLHPLNPIPNTTATTTAPTTGGACRQAQARHSRAAGRADGGGEGGAPPPPRQGLLGQRPQARRRAAGGAGAGRGGDGGGWCNEMELGRGGPLIDRSPSPFLLPSPPTKLPPQQPTNQQVFQMIVDTAPIVLLVLSVATAAIIQTSRLTPPPLPPPLAVTTRGDAPVILFANDAAARLLHWDPSELLMRCVFVVNIRPPPDVVAFAPADPPCPLDVSVSVSIRPLLPCLLLPSRLTDHVPTPPPPPNSTVWDVIHPADRPAVRAAYEDLLLSGPRAGQKQQGEEVRLCGWNVYGVGVVYIPATRSTDSAHTNPFTLDSHLPRAPLPRPQPPAAGTRAPRQQQEGGPLPAAGVLPGLRRGR